MQPSEDRLAYISRAGHNLVIGLKTCLERAGIYILGINPGYARNFYFFSNLSC